MLLPPPLRICFAAIALLAAPANAQVVFSEIHYHPVEEPAFNADGTPVLDLTDDVYEFVEIQNAGTAVVDLTGWTLSGGIDFKFPAGATIAAGGWRVVAKDPARLQALYAIAGVLGPYTGKLNNSGDTVRIKNAAGTTVDSVTYSPDFPWAMSANALGANDRFTGLTAKSYQYKGRSLQRVSVTAPSNDPANWLASPLTGPTPGAAQAVTRAVPKPVVIAQSRTQASDGAAIIRANKTVTVNATFSSLASLSSVQVEYFVDNVGSTTEARTTMPMTDLGNGVFTAILPGQVDRSIVRYRFIADRGDGVEVVSPRADDPQIAPVGAGGAREAWHGYFVTPARVSSNPVYDLLIGTTALTKAGTNIGQSPQRVTALTAIGQPREVPYVPAGSPEWDGTVPAVFATNGVLYDVHFRYHGSRYHRSTTNLSFKLHFPDFQPYNRKTSLFVTGHSASFAEVHGMQRMLGLASSKMRAVDWYFNSSGLLVREEQGEYDGEMLDDFHELQQRLNPGSAREATGEIYKVVGNLFDGSQNNAEGPYTMGDQAPMLANAGWTQLQRYEWTYAMQSNRWKGSLPIRNLIEGLWPARGSPYPSTNVNVVTARAWMDQNFDIDAMLTSTVLMQWIGIWDDTGHNQFFWRRANNKWVRLGWDFDGTMSDTGANIYAGESDHVAFVSATWVKDTFLRAYRAEFNQRMWELNNSFFDPTNLTALGFPAAASFASGRQGLVNSQLNLGTFYKPARPTNVLPANSAAVLAGAVLQTSAYSTPNNKAHAKTKWEIRTATGNYDEPVLRLTTATNLTSLPVPFDQLTYGQAYYWRVTHIDADGHNSIVSAETSFSWGTASPNAGTLVLNEILADNRHSAENGGAHPDYIELFNNSATPYVLDGRALTDDPAIPGKYPFPTGTTIPAYKSLVVWCDSDISAPGLHTGFALDAAGQTVLLTSNGTILDSVTFGPQAPDISIGRVGDGTGGWQANKPTPGTPNSALTLGPTTSLRINEWMASPSTGSDWFEIYNADANPVPLSSLYLSDDPAHPTTTRIAPLSFIAGKGFTKFVADGSTAGGHHANFKLSGSGDNLVLTPANGAGTLDVITFGAQAEDVSQGRLPDGAAAIATFADTATPGGSNWRAVPVVISEVLSNSSPPYEDAIEVYNPTGSSVDIGGWWLSDDTSFPQKFQIPPGTAIAAGGRTVFYESQFNTGDHAFSLSSLGDEASLAAVDGTGALTGYRAQVHFGAADENVPFGRVNIAGGAEFWPQTALTLGFENAAPKTTPVLINEILYHPADVGGMDNSADEFIELHNPTTSPVDLSGWRLQGDSHFNFAPGTTLRPGDYVLLVGFDPASAPALAAFRSHYGLDDSTRIYGPFAPKLSNSAHRVELVRPGKPVGFTTPLLLVDRAEYRDRAPWPIGVDGTGQSIQRISRAVIGNDAANWAAGQPTPGTNNRSQSAIDDNDGDGMSNAWEDAQGFDKFNAADAADDADADGQSNLGELLAGTDPHNARSVFKMDATRLADGGFRITFAALPGKSYAIQYCDSLGSGYWQTLSTTAPSAKKQTITHDDHTQNRQRFYRVVTPAPP